MNLGLVPVDPEELRQAVLYLLALAAETHDNKPAVWGRDAVLGKMVKEVHRHRTRRAEIVRKARLADLVDSCVDLLEDEKRGVIERVAMVDKVRRWSRLRGIQLDEEQARDVLWGSPRDGAKADSVRQRLFDRLGDQLSVPNNDGSTSPGPSGESMRQYHDAGRGKNSTRSAIRTPEAYETAFHDDLPSRGRVLGAVMRWLGYSAEETVKGLVAMGVPEGDAKREFGDPKAFASVGVSREPVAALDHEVIRALIHAALGEALPSASVPAQATDSLDPQTAVGTDAGHRVDADAAESGTEDSSHEKAP